MLPVFATHRVDAFVLNAASAIWFLPEVIRSYARRPISRAGTNDRLSAPFLMACLWFGVAAALACAYRAPGLAIPWHRTLLFYTGVVLMLAGVAFRWYSIHVLGRFFTTVVATQPGQTVIEKGPYHYIRHPSYSGALLTFLGLGLALGNWLSTAVILVMASAGYAYRIWVEERTLLASLGDSYRVYMQHTRRIIPFVF